MQEVCYLPVTMHSVFCTCKNEAGQPKYLRVAEFHSLLKEKDVLSALNEMKEFKMCCRNNYMANVYRKDILTNVNSKIIIEANNLTYTAKDFKIPSILDNAKPLDWIN